MNLCPCGSGKSYETCCGPLHAGTEKAATAEALMRSRFSAYVKRQYDYLGQSLHPNHRKDYDPIATQRWADESDWLSLQVVSKVDGGEQDNEGQVEFIATYREKGIIQPHHEKGIFRRHKGEWYYVDGKLVPQATQRLETPKVGRNDPCPCGSGKKYKKCCGR